MSARTIVMVRHGRSAHVHAGWVDLAGFLRWRESYEAAGIDTDDTPPREVQELAASARLVVASDVPRAMESARLLAPGTSVATSPLLRELDLVPPNLGRLRLPLFGWALTFGVRMLLRVHGQAHVTPGEHERARSAARWLATLADEHGRIVAVTHASFRAVLAKQLEAEGWQSTVPRRRSAHWSAWTFSRQT